MYVNYNIKINFPVGNILKEQMEEAEALDKAGDGEYSIVADIIDVYAKNMYSAEKLTKKQWDTLTERYPYV